MYLQFSEAYAFSMERFDLLSIRDAAILTASLLELKLILHVVHLTLMLEFEGASRWTENLQSRKSDGDEICGDCGRKERRETYKTVLFTINKLN